MTKKPRTRGGKAGVDQRVARLASRRAERIVFTRAVVPSSGRSTLGFMRVDPIALIEEAYRPAVSPTAWLRAHAPQVMATFDVDELGTFSYFVRGQRPEEPHWQEGRRGGLDAATAREVVARGYGTATPEQLRRAVLAIRTPGVHTLVETIGGVMPASAEIMPFPVADSPAVMIPTGDDRVAVATGLTREPLHIDDGTHALWERIALHLGAACRLAGRPTGPDAPDVEAVLDPGGEVQHATGPAQGAQAREQLREAVRRMDEARTRAGRADPMKALDLWHGLLAGRWSLVDHFDGDGRRFLLARKNDPEAPHPSALARRQRQVVFYASLGWSLQQIAFALGLAESTVGRHLSVALVKLGLPSRAELVRVTTEMAVAAMLGAAPPSS